MKFKDITIKKNGVVVGTKSRSVWLEISDKGLFYLSWNEGRLYFVLDKMAAEVKNFQCNNGSQSVTFRWDGEWWVVNNLTNVNDSYEIIFNSKDFKKIVNLLK